MALNFCFDTTFLIDLQKERGKGTAHTFLDMHRTAAFFWNAIVLAEFAEGFASTDDPMLLSISKGPLYSASPGRRGLIYSRLTRTGKLIGSNDLWIASHALQHELTLVTADPAHFSRVPGLRLLSY